MILLASQFTGFHDIKTNPVRINNRLQEFIDSSLQGHLVDLLGCEYGNTVYTTDVESLPDNLAALFETQCLSDEYCYDAGVNRFYKGLEWVLKGLIYYDYVRNNSFVNTNTGVVVNQNETSNQVSNLDLYRVCEIRYNDAVNNIDTLKRWIYENKDDYPDFKQKTYHYSLSIL